MMQSIVVAAYRTDGQAEAVIAEEQKKRMRQQAARGKSGSPKGRSH